MKRILLSVCALVALVSCQKEDSRVVTQQMSPEGQAFTFMPVHEDGVTDISIEVAWPTAWAYDDAKNPAVPFVATQAILSGGTREIPPQDLLVLFEDTNTYGNMVATPQYVFGSISFPKEYTKDVLDVVSEMLAQPLFEDRWLEREKANFANGIETHSTTAEQKMWSAARTAIFGDQALNRTLNLSDPAVVMAVTREEVQDWHKSVITKVGATVVVTGAISSEDAGKAVDRLFAGLPEGAPMMIQNASANFEPVNILLHDPDAAQTIIGFVGQLPSDQKGLFYEDHLAMGFFSRAGKSDLFDALRTDLRASYQMYAGVEHFDNDNRFLFIGGGVEASKLSAAKIVVQTAYEAYRTEPNLEGFDNHRRALADYVAEDIDYIDGAAEAILQVELVGQDSTLVPQADNVVVNTTAAEVAARMASVFPHSDDLIVVAISPDANALPGACVITEFVQAKDCR